MVLTKLEKNNEVSVMVTGFRQQVASFHGQLNNLLKDMHLESKTVPANLLNIKDIEKEYDVKVVQKKVRNSPNLTIHIVGLKNSVEQAVSSIQNSLPWEMQQQTFTPMTESTSTEEEKPEESTKRNSRRKRTKKPATPGSEKSEENSEKKEDDSQSTKSEEDDDITSETSSVADEREVEEDEMAAMLSSSSDSDSDDDEDDE